MGLPFAQARWDHPSVETHQGSGVEWSEGVGSVE